MSLPRQGARITRGAQNVLQKNDELIILCLSVLVWLYVMHVKHALVELGDSSYLRSRMGTSYRLSKEASPIGIVSAALMYMYLCSDIVYERVLTADTDIVLVYAKEIAKAALAMCSNVSIRLVPVLVLAYVCTGSWAVAKAHYDACLLASPLVLLLAIGFKANRMRAYCSLGMALWLILFWEPFVASMYLVAPLRTRQSVSRLTALCFFFCKLCLDYNTRKKRQYRVYNLNAPLQALLLFTLAVYLIMYNDITTRAREEEEEVGISFFGSRGAPVHREPTCKPLGLNGTYVHLWFVDRLYESLCQRIS